MPRPRNEPLKIAQRRARVAELYLQGKYQWEIALVVNVTQATVSRDIAALSSLWRESGVRNFDEAKAQELARINRLERVYWDAWERSLEASKRESKKLIDQPGGGRTAEVGTTTEESYGDPRFLAGVQWCISKRCAILGLDAPTKVAPVNPDGETPYQPGNNIVGALALELRAAVERCRAAGGATGAVEPPGQPIGESS